MLGELCSAHPSLLCPSSVLELALVEYYSANVTILTRRRDRSSNTKWFASEESSQKPHAHLQENPNSL